MTERKKLTTCLALLLGLHALVAFAGFFAPYDPAAQDRMAPYLPPMRVHVIDGRGRWHLRPFAYQLEAHSGSPDGYHEKVPEAVPVKFFVKGAGYRAFGFISARTHLLGTDRTALHLLGTDAFGRDLFSRILFGGQISLLAGLLGTGITLFLGLSLGAAAGYYGGWRDEALMRVAELFLALPWLYLLFGLRAFLPLSVRPAQAFLLVVCVIGALGWARPARLVRGIVLSAKERDFVRAARGFGASNAYLLWRHVLPETSSVLLTQAAILVPQFVLAEMTLSFLGLGVPEPVPSWGNLLSSLQQYSVLVSYWWMYLPAVAMVPFFLGYLRLASLLQSDAANPKIEAAGGA